MIAKRIAAPIVLGSLTALLLTSCSSTEDPRPLEDPTACTVPAGPIAFAVGGRANMPGVPATPALSDIVTEAAANESHVTVFDTGGTPRQVASYTLDLMAKNPAAREQEQARNAAALAKGLIGVKADSPEANPLEALNKAAEAVAGTGPGTVVLVDSGLQTTGAFSYASGNVIMTKPEDLVQAIQSAGQMPDLTDKQVFLIGLGDTAEPQAPLDASARRNLQAQWEAIVKAAGADCVFVDPTELTGQPDPSLPPVTPVLIAQSTFVPPSPGKPFILGEELPFQSDSDQFLDPDRARDVLEPLAEWLKTERTPILLTGTTSSDGEEAGQIRLSKARAERVKKELVALGADANLIETRGVGPDFDGFQPDRDADGNLIEEKAAQNRLVIITVR